MSALAHELPGLADAAAVPSRTLRDHLGMLRRRRGLALTVFGTLLALTVVVAVVLPPVYRSTATILIKEQEIPQEFVRSTVTSFADERIQVISQQVMTRATLLELVDRHGLYGKARQRETSEEILDRMRRDIKLTPISAEVTDRRTGSPVKSTIAFTLSYDSESASAAQKIANELTTLYLNENVKNRQQKAAETTSFLDEELARVTRHIAELEQKLAGFKERNQGKLPELNLSNQMGSERTASEIQRLEREILFLNERTASLQTQLAETKPQLPVTGANGAVLDADDRLKALQMQLSAAIGTFSSEHPDVKRLRREIAVLQAETGEEGDTTDREARRRELEAQLSVLRQKFADDHPDVSRTKRQLAALDEAAPAVPRTTRKPDNPVYLNLKAQIDTNAAQLISLKKERDELRGRLALYDMRVSASPEVEREYLEIARDMDSSRMRFRELRDKQMQAQVAEQLERERKAERFTLIEPPIFPEKPVRPNRLLIVVMGLVLALAVGVGAAAMRESFDRAVHGQRDVMRVLQVPVLAVLPALEHPAVKRRRARLRLAWAATGLVVLLLGITAFHFFYMPIDVAWYALLRRVAP